MQVVFRPNDPIRPEDDIILRAGGGNVEALVNGAINNADDYADLHAAGVVRSRYTVSVHVPRGALTTSKRVVDEPLYGRYKAYIEARAAELSDLDFLEIVATTVINEGEEPSDLDLCHYDLVVMADSHDDLHARIATLRDRFTRHDR